MHPHGTSLSIFAHMQVFAQALHAVLPVIERVRPPSWYTSHAHRWSLSLRVHRYAIAHAVLAHLSSSVDCRLLFATHYHPLTAEFGDNHRVALAHMAALVGDASPGSEAGDGITFLYQLRSGACPRSYGLQVRS